MHTHTHITTYSHTHVPAYPHTHTRKTLTYTHASQASLNEERVKLYVSEFGAAALRLLNGPASAQLSQLTEPSAGFLRWRDGVGGPTRSHAQQQQQQQVREARASSASAPGARSAKGPMQMLSQSGASKLMRLGVNLGGNPLEPPTNSATRVRRGARLQMKTRTQLYPATSGTDHYAAPGAFHANCGVGSPTALCDHGVFVGEQEQTHAQDVAMAADKMEASYNTGVSPVRELQPNTIGGDFFGHIGEAPITREQVQELSR